jgi:hypothetical protein
MRQTQREDGFPEPFRDDHRRAILRGVKGGLMPLQAGDQVRTDDGQEGKLMLLNKDGTSALVEVHHEMRGPSIVRYYLSELALIRSGPPEKRKC